MEEKDIIKLWKQNRSSGSVKIDQNRLQSEIKKRVTDMNKMLSKRNNREIAVAIILMPIGLALGFVMPNPFVKLGCFLIVPYALLVVYMLKKTHRAKAKPDASLTHKDFLQRSLDHINKEIQLLNSVLYWYILPAAVCSGLVIWGLTEGVVRLLFNYSVIIGMMIFIYLLNKKAVKEDLEPYKKNLLDALERISQT